MKRIVVTVTAMLGLLSIGEIQATAASSPSPKAPVQKDHCTKYGDTTACGDTSSIDVSGGTSQGGDPSKSGDASGPVVDPPGTKRLVACGAGAAGQLGAIGDPNGALDATSECQSVDVCDAETQRTGKPHQLYVRAVKQDDGTYSLTGSECNAVPNAPPVITPLMVWEEAQRRILPAAIGLAPHTNTLVNEETIMWVDTPRERDLDPVTILGQPVTIHITVTTVAWDYGDDHADPNGPIGTPYDAKNNPCKTKQCADYDGHTYTTTGHLTITAAVTWHATFRVNNGPVVDIPGPLTGPTANAEVNVQEARSVLVPDPTSH